MKVVAKVNLIYSGQFIKAGTEFDVPAPLAESISGVEPKEDPLKSAEFSTLVSAIEQAKSGKQPNLNPIKADLIAEYASLMGVETDGRSKSDIFADIVKEVGSSDASGKPAS